MARKSMGSKFADGDAVSHVDFPGSCGWILSSEPFLDQYRCAVIWDDMEKTEHMEDQLRLKQPQPPAAPGDEDE